MTLHEREIDIWGRVFHLLNASVGVYPTVPLIHLDDITNGLQLRFQPFVNVILSSMVDLVVKLASNTTCTTLVKKNTRNSAT